MRLILDTADLGKEFLVLLRVKLIELLELFLFLLPLLFIVRDLVSFVRIDIEVFNEVLLATAALGVGLLGDDLLIRLGIEYNLLAEPFEVVWSAIVILEGLYLDQVIKEMDVALDVFDEAGQLC